MTRLEKDAIKRLIILGAAFAAAGIIYYFSRQLRPSLCGFGLMGLTGLVDGSRKFNCKEPKLESSDLKKIKLLSLITIVLFFAFFGFILWQNAPPLYNDKILIWIVFSVICIGIFFIIAMQKYENIFVKKTVVLPKYDEREDKVLKKTYILSFGIFFGIFLLFNLIAGGKTFNRQIPGYILSLEAVVSAWLFLFILNIAILWQERKIGNESSCND